MPSIDLHAHILPGVDDGPEALEGSLALARAAVAAGTDLMVATPHVNESRFIEPGAIPAAVEALAGHLADAGIDLELQAGAEIALPRVLDLDDEDLRALALGHSRCVLLESPFAPAGTFEVLIHEVLARGHPVLLAHPERCPAFQREPARLAALVEAGVHVQITAGALTGRFGTRVREVALRLLRDGLVHVVASDAHDDVRRPPGLTAGLAAAEAEIPGLAMRRRWLSEAAPAALLTDTPVPEPTPLPPLRGWRRARAAWSAR